ncbi:type I-E CRISPR-associated protein Cas5/CasD [Streptomyces luteogriseus]|uniref:type I-E CRISPR-associated protein Cas5/CasD n=1 Tax=Streptomyces luteogriseus TaxID=68233 RepID=UPI0036E941DD
MSGLVLRLAGLLQSFGERGVFHYRDTCAFPTRSALIGMFAAAQGRPREHALDPYPHLQAPGDTTAPSHRDLTLTVRIDQPGTLYRDFHTVGGGRPREQSLRTGDGTRRKPAASTLVSHRDYLTGAVYTVAVTGPAMLTAHIAETLERPRFGLFLGRRACLPDEPLLLNPDSPDPVQELLTRTPPHPQPAPQPRRHTPAHHLRLGTPTPRHRPHHPTRPGKHQRTRQPHPPRPPPPATPPVDDHRTPTRPPLRRPPTD